MQLNTLPSYENLATLFVGSCALALPFLLTAETIRRLLWTFLSPVTYLKKRTERYRFIIDAPAQLEDRYKEANGGLFVIRTSDAHTTFVSSKKFIRELDRASRDVLSLQAAAKWLLQPQYSMAKFNWSDKRGHDGAPLLVTLRTILRANLPFILPKTRLANLALLDKMFKQSGNKPHMNDMVRAAIANTNAIAFFGEELANDEKFVAAAVSFNKHVWQIAEAVRLLPTFIGERVAQFLETYYGAQRTILAALETVAQQRIDEWDLAQSGHSVPKHRDCIQWVMEQSRNIQAGQEAEITTPWTAERVAHELMAQWFGAYHAVGLASIFALQDICLHPEYIEPLRREFAGPAYDEFERTGHGLPLLDSFLRESSRMCPVDNISTRRKVLEPFEFSNGLRLERGQWICTPLKAMHIDPRRWVRPLEFHGFRHVDPAVLASIDLEQEFESPDPTKARTFTDVRLVDSWQTWGTGNMACPGRFYAAAAIKQVVGLMVSTYDLTLEERRDSCRFTYRSCTLPKAGVSITVRQRGSSMA